MDSESLLALAAENQRRARAVLAELQAEAAWRSAGATPHLVGSLRTGLLMTHRDIDLHIYSPVLSPEGSFAAMARIARNPRIRRIEYANLLDAEDRCIEWHAQYADTEGDLWQIDMIHMSVGSPWEGYFERVADRISAVLTDETRRAVLQIKYDTPDEVKIMGIEYYRAVLGDGVRTYAEFEAWRAANPVEGILEWMP